MHYGECTHIAIFIFNKFCLLIKVVAIQLAAGDGVVSVDGVVWGGAGADDG